MSLNDLADPVVDSVGLAGFKNRANAFLLALAALSLLSSSTIFPWGRVDDLSFFEYLSPFCFLSIEFLSTFSISYKILPYFVLLLLYLN